LFFSYSSFFTSKPAMARPFAIAGSHYLRLFLNSEDNKFLGVKKCASILADPVGGKIYVIQNCKAEQIL